MGEEKIGEVVDGGNGQERHLSVWWPGEVGAEHHGEVARRHLIEAAPVLHLERETIKLLTLFKKLSLEYLS